MSMSNYLENKLVDHVFRAMSFTAPTHLYLSLHSADPGDTGASELANSNAYARADPGANNYDIWKSTQDTALNEASSGTGGVTKNAAIISFTACSTAPWAEATYFGVWDSGTYGGGNPIGFGQLTTPKTVQVNDVASFAAGALTVTFS